jgi:hypothetical protein
MNREHARRLLNSIGFLKHRCDLDLLLFFVRHPRSLLTSDQIAAFLGYDLKRIGDSLENLLSAKLLTRSQSPTHAARLYVFAVNGTSDGWLPSLVEAVSTREGRLALRQAMTDMTKERINGRFGRSPGDQIAEAG